MAAREAFRRAGRRLVAGLFLLLVLAAAVAAGLWWWSGTQASLDWALERFAQPQSVVAEGATGSLRHGARIERLTWEQDGLQVQASDAELAWQPLALLHRQVRVTRLAARSVEVQDRRPPSAEPPQPPGPLDLPLRVSVDEIELGELRWSGDADVQASGIAGRYGYDGSRHQLTLASLQLAQGRYSGEATLGDHAPLPLQARLKGELSVPVPGAAQPLPLRLVVTGAGPLQGFDVRAQLEAASGSPSASAPSATVTARVTPWQPPYVPRAQARLQQLDLAALWPQAPTTALRGRVSVAPHGTATWGFDTDLANTAPGPWDRQRLPLERLHAQGEWRAGAPVLVRQFSADLGGGRADGRGRWAENGWQLEGRVQDVNPAALHTQLAPQPLSGPLRVQARGDALDFGFDLQAAGETRPAPPDPDRPLLALTLRRLQAEGRWQAGWLNLSQLHLRTADASLQGRLTARPAERSGEGRLRLSAPGLNAQAEGRLAPRQGGGSLAVDATALEQATAWLATLPGVPAGLPPRLAGQARLEARWQGGWTDPTLQARLRVPRLAAVDPATPPESAWTLRDASASLEGRLAQATLQAEGVAVQGQRRLRAQLAGTLGQVADGWQGRVASLALAATGLVPATEGEWRLRLQQPFGLSWRDGVLQAEAGSALLHAPVRRGPSQARLAWQPLRWGQGELETAGQLEGLPMSWIELFTGGELPGAPLGGDLVFDGRWQARLGDQVRLSASLTRTGGDLSLLAEAADGTSTRLNAGVREARLSLEGTDENIRLGLRWDSERAGTADGWVATRLRRGGDAGWEWAPDAPLDGRLQAQLPRLRVWSLLAPPGWRVRGSLAADLSLSGTREQPQLQGRLAADDLALRSLVDGVALEDGRLRARVEGQRVVIEELLLRGAGPEGGTVRATGVAQAGPDGLRLEAQAQLDRLRASIRSDRRLTVSGQANAVVAAGRTEITGALHVDQARIVLPEETAPRLGDDVVVRNLPPGVSLRAPESSGPSRPLRLAVDIDLGRDFRVSGRGVDTELRGNVRVTGESLAQPRLTGTVQTEGGHYMAYGQRLDIERGVLRFTGPADNPALDVLAVRPNLAQKVGVQVTGRAQAPVVRLYSSPPLSEAETLSWLVLGRASAAGGAEAALLQRAALALVAGRGGASGGLAQRFGLDELSVRREGEQGPAITLGKRFADNLYAAYERTLSGAVGTLYLFYDLSRRLTLRAEAGDRTGLDLIYTLSFD